MPSFLPSVPSPCPKRPTQARNSDIFQKQRAEHLLIREFHLGTRRIFCANFQEEAEFMWSRSQAIAFIGISVFITLICGCREVTSVSEVIPTSRSLAPPAIQAQANPGAIVAGQSSSLRLVHNRSRCRLNRRPRKRAYERLEERSTFSNHNVHTAS